MVYGTPTGQITEFPASYTIRITAGPDGAMWFTDFSGGLDRIDSSGSVQSFPVSNSSFLGGSPFGLTSGPDGNLWVADNFTAIDVFGLKPGFGIVANYNAGPNSFPQNIVAGPDGNLWFTDQGTGGIQRIGTKGGFTSFPLGLFMPDAITVGPDDNLWFQTQDFNPAGGTVGKISTSGASTLYQIGFTTYAEDIIAGPDGALWIPENDYVAGNPAIAVIGTDGTLLDRVGTSYVGGSADGIAVGPDHKLWVTLNLGGRISRLSAIHGSGNAISGAIGGTFSGAVATFVDGTPTATPSDFTASIDWGDGATSAGTVSGGTGGPFQVSGNHAFVKSGNLITTITLHDTVDSEDYHARGAAKVQPGLLPSNTGLVSSLNPAGTGQSVTFTATVASTATATGNVQFEDFGNLLQTVALNGSGVATFMTSSLAAGPHEISAVYAGDGLHAGSTSNTVDEIITTAGQAATTTAVVPSKTFLTGALGNRSVTLTATVTTGGATATGTVSFYAGTRLLKTQTLDNTGHASLITSELNVGGNEVTAAYSGDPNFAASVSAVVVVYRSPEPR